MAAASRDHEPTGHAIEEVRGSARRRPVDPAAGRRSQRPALTRDVRRLLAVIAHPDESFGLGALLDRFA